MVREAPPGACRRGDAVRERARAGTLRPQRLRTIAATERAPPYRSAVTTTLL
jgi:hypothetical protein